MYLVDALQGAATKDGQKKNEHTWLETNKRRAACFSYFGSLALRLLQPFAAVALGSEVGGLLASEGAASVTAAIARGPKTFTHEEAIAQPDAAIVAPAPATLMHAYHPGASRHIGYKSAVSIVEALVVALVATCAQRARGQVAAIKDELAEINNVLADLIDV